VKFCTHPRFLLVDEAMSSLPLLVCLDGSELELERKLLAGQADVECYSAKTSDQIPLSLETAAIVEVWHSIWITPELLARMPNVKCIVRMGVGYDNVDIKAAGELGIPVCNIPNYGTDEVADTALWGILSLYRQTAHLATSLSGGVAVEKGPAAIAEAAGPHCRRTRGRCLGIVGFGRIGTATALRAKACGFRVVFFDPYVQDGLDKAIGVERVESIIELFSIADCISLHCNATKDNERMINSEVLNAAKPGTFLVNTARGELVDDEALLQALESGRLGGAFLDVHWSEPFRKHHSDPLGTRGAKLLEDGRLICTPHVAWYSRESSEEMRALGVATAKRALHGEPLRNVVNLQFLKNPRSPVMSARL